MVNYVTPFMRRTVCAILLSLLLSVPVTAAGAHRFFNIGREAGLGDLEVVGIRRDSVGYMWFYTPQATFRYDGYSFLRHDGPGHGAADAVGSLVIPELGQRWAATDNDGIAIYGAGGEMAGRLRREDGNPFSLPTNHITCLYRDGDGTVWVGTSKGGVAYCSVYGLDFSVTALPRHEDASCFWEPGDGSLWIGLDGKGIVQLSADGRVATTIDNTNSALTSNSVIGACRNADGSFYLATYGGGIVRFDGGRLSRPRWGLLPSVRYPHKMAYDTHGNLWIGSVKTGLTRIDASGRATVYTYSNSGLNTNAVTDVASDRSGRVFVATGTGLAYISDRGGRQRVVAASADTSATSLGRMPITAIAVDGRRMLWVGPAGVQAAQRPRAVGGRGSCQGHSRRQVGKHVGDDRPRRPAGYCTGRGRRLPLRLPSVFLWRWRRQALVCQIFALLHPWRRHHSRHLRPDSKDRPPFGKTVERRPHGNRHRRGR